MDLPPLPPPHGYWADGSAGWSAEEIETWGLELLELSNEDWRRAAMTMIEAFVPAERRTSAHERLGIAVGRRLNALRRLRRTPPVP